MAIFDNNEVKEVQEVQTGEPQVLEVHEENLDEVPEVQVETQQVKPDTIVFVAQEDFEGRINQETFRFQKGVRYEVTRDQANTWVDADKGYTIEA